MNESEAKALLEEVLRRANPAGQWCPHTPHPKQKTFLALDCFEALFGGAAGPGKSDALLMAALQYVDRPEYAALLLRRSYTDLSLPGALMDRAAGWLRPTAAQWTDKEKRWTFPSGATLTFGYLEAERDKYRYQGPEFQFVGFDELTQFLESQYTYLLSRLRRLKGSDIPLRARSASNPGGLGHLWVKDRFIDSSDDNCRFIPARLEDNPHIDQVEYRLALSKLDGITRAQLEDGLWVQDTTGQLYKYLPSRNDVDGLPDGTWSHILAGDFGTSELRPSSSLTVLAYNLQQAAVYAVFSDIYAGLTPSDIAEEVIRLRGIYGGFRAMVFDAGGLGGGYIKEFRQRWALPAKAAEKANKLGYRKLLNGDLEHGKLMVMPHTCAPLIQELQELQWNEKGTDCPPNAVDHSTDSLLYGWREAKHWLAKEPAMPPEKGTDEWMKQEEGRLRAAAAERVKRRSTPPWKRGRRKRSSTPIM